MVETWWMHMTTKSFFFISKNTIWVSACNKSITGEILWRCQHKTQSINGELLGSWNPTAQGRNALHMSCRAILLAWYALYNKATQPNSLQLCTSEKNISTFGKNLWIWRGHSCHQDAGCKTRALKNMYNGTLIRVKSTELWDKMQ